MIILKDRGFDAVDDVSASSTKDSISREEFIVAYATIKFKVTVTGQAAGPVS